MTSTRRADEGEALSRSREALSITPFLVDAKSPDTVPAHGVRYAVHFTARCSLKVDEYYYYYYVKYTPSLQSARPRGYDAVKPWLKSVNTTIKPKGTSRVNDEHISTVLGRTVFATILYTPLS